MSVSFSLKSTQKFKQNSSLMVKSDLLNLSHGKTSCFWACWSSLRIKIKLIRSQQWAWKHCAPNLSKREDGCLYLKHNEKYEWFKRDSNPTSVAFFLGYNIDGFCLICAQLVNGLSCVKRFLFVVWVWTWVGDSNTPSQLEYELQYQIFHKVYIIAYINI